MDNKQLDYFKNNLDRHTIPTSPDDTPKTTVKLRRRDSLALAEKRLETAGASTFVKETLLSEQAKKHFKEYTSNIENYIGTVNVPLGLAGPLQINGSYAKGEYYIPLATSEAALVASYNRGLFAIKESGGCTSMVFAHEVQRAPFFKFDNMLEASQFIKWIDDNKHILKYQAEQTSNHAKLLNIKYQIDSTMVVLIFNYTTGDAAGQNMVTFATNAAYQFILDNCPIKSSCHALEGNNSGDKKFNFLSRLNARGYKVAVECRLSKDILSNVLGTDIEQYINYVNAVTECGILNMGVNFQAHFANSIAAMFIACGQDAACVAEAATGISKCYRYDNDSVYLSVTMPNLIVGTVGGGTGLPHQKACLELIGLKGKDNTAAEFAEICAATCLAGEISLTAAICSGHFSDAHDSLARKRKRTAKTLKQDQCEAEPC